MRRYFSLLFCLSVLIGLLAACGDTIADRPTVAPASATPPPSPTATVEPTSTATPLPSPTAVPSPTVPPSPTPLPSPTPDITTDFQPFIENGVTLSYPADWLVSNEADPFRFLSSTTDFLDGSIDEGELGALVAIIPLAVGPETPLAAVLADVIDEYGISEGETTGAVETLTINGQTAVRQSMPGEINAGEPFTAFYTVIRAQGRTIAFVALAPTAEIGSYQPVLETIVASAQIEALTTAVNPSGELTPFFDPVSGLTFRYPAGWLLEQDEFDDNRMVILATDETMLDVPENAVGGALLQVTIGSGNEWDVGPGGTAVAGLEAFIADLDTDDELSLAQEPTATVINGLPAATTTGYVNSDEFTGYLTLAFLLHEEQSVVVLAATPLSSEAAYAPILDTIIASIYVAVSSRTYPHEDMPLLFRYPAGWRIEDVGDEGIVLSSDPDIDQVETFDAGAVQFIFWTELETPLPPATFLDIFVDSFDLIEDLTEVEAVAAQEINGQEAATAVYEGAFIGGAVQVRFTVLVVEAQTVAAVAITAQNDVAALQPLQDGVTNSIRVAGGPVDHTDPVAVVEALFIAAQTEDFALLAGLCDPLGENDGDTADLCAINDDHERRDLFVAYFAVGEIIGTPVIEEDRVTVPIRFGPEGEEEEEEIELILRDGGWYLYGF